MPVRQKFLNKTLDGREYVPFWIWARTLPEHELKDLQQADDRQLAYRRQAIKNGDLVVDPKTNDYIWRDQDTAEKGKQQDPVWVDYWLRWMQECAIDPDHYVMKPEDE